MLQKHEVISQRLQHRGAEEFSRNGKTSIPASFESVKCTLYLPYQPIHLLMLLEQCLNITAISKLRTFSFIHGASWMITILLY